MTTTTERLYFHHRINREGLPVGSLNLLDDPKREVETEAAERLYEVLLLVVSGLPYGIAESDLKAAVTTFLHRNLCANDAEEYGELLFETLTVFDDVVRAVIRSGEFRHIVIGDTLRIVEGYTYDRRHEAGGDGR